MTCIVVVMHSIVLEKSTKNLIHLPTRFEAHPIVFILVGIQMVLPASKIVPPKVLKRPVKKI